MSSNTIDFDSEGYDEYLPLQKPSPLIFYIALVSVVAGTLLGVFGIVRSISGATEALEYIVGSIGYLFTGIIPVICYKIFSTSHVKACSHNREQPYDIHGGNTLRSRVRKIAVIGLAVAIMPIWVFFFPIAQGMIK